jgi:hypothetical protein
LQHTLIARKNLKQATHPLNVLRLGDIILTYQPLLDVLDDFLLFFCHYFKNLSLMRITTIDSVIAATMVNINTPNIIMMFYCGMEEARTPLLHG